LPSRKSYDSLVVIGFSDKRLLWSFDIFVTSLALRIT